MEAWEELDRHRYANQRGGVLQVRRKGFDKGICYHAVFNDGKRVNVCPLNGCLAAVKLTFSMAFR